MNGKKNFYTLFILTCYLMIWVLFLPCSFVFGSENYLSSRKVRKPHSPQGIVVYTGESPSQIIDQLQKVYPHNLNIESLGKVLDILSIAQTDFLNNRQVKIKFNTLEFKVSKKKNEIVISLPSFSLSKRVMFSAFTDEFPEFQTVQTLIGLLPSSQIEDPKAEFLYDFISQTWALLLSYDVMDRNNFQEKLLNLENLYNTLPRDLGEDKLIKYRKMLDVLKSIYDKEMVYNSTLFYKIFNLVDNSTYIDIYYKRRMLLGTLTRTKGNARNGAFAPSQATTIKNISDMFLTPGKSKVLDLGSGNAKAVSLFSQAAAYVKGIEIDLELYQEGIDCINDLAKKDKLNKDKITLEHGNFFNEDFSNYDFIYIYWPFNDLENSVRREKIRNRLEQKLLKEMKPKAVFVVCVPGIGDESLFPKLKRIDIKPKFTSSHLYAYSLP